MASQIEIEIVSPTEIVARDSGVTEVIIPAHWGQMDVLPGHADFMTVLRAGELIYKKGKERRAFNITGGLFTVTRDKATVLADGMLATVTPIEDARKKRAA